MKITVVQHPLAVDALHYLRSVDTLSDCFQQYCHLVSAAVLMEATRELPLLETEVASPLEHAKSATLADQPVFIPILRAGLGMLRVARELFPKSAVGHMGIERNELTAEASTYYSKIPSLHCKSVIILDPMLATGGSACSALNFIKQNGIPKSITLACIVAAPEGLQNLNTNHSDVRIVTAALDRQLNEMKYILPGLGDFGDRYFNT